MLPLYFAFPLLIWFLFFAAVGMWDLTCRFFLKFERMMSCSTGYENREPDATLKCVGLLAKVHAIFSQTIANFEHHDLLRTPMVRVLKYSVAEPENFSRTSRSKPEVAVKCDIALSYCICILEKYGFWKMLALTPSLRKSFQNILHNKTPSWNEQYWEVLMLPEVCVCCSFFVLVNKSPDKHPVFLLQVDRWNARLLLWISALENPKTDFGVLRIRSVTWHSQFYKKLDASDAVTALLCHNTDLVTCHNLGVFLWNMF